MTFVWVVDTDDNEIERRLAYLFIAWLLDSVFNDVCVAFVGFGPTSNALQTVGNAAKADIIGAVTTESVKAPEGAAAVGTVVHYNSPAISMPSAPDASSKNVCD